MVEHPRLYASYKLKLDAKGRFFIPAKRRHVFSEGALLTVWQSNSLLLIPVNYFETWESEVFEKLTIVENEYTKLKRHLYGKMSLQDLDKAGRVIIPTELQEYARIKKDVTIVGFGKYYEIWATERWEEYNSIEEIDKFFKSVQAPFEKPVVKTE